MPFSNPDSSLLTRRLSSRFPWPIDRQTRIEKSGLPRVLLFCTLLLAFTLIGCGPRESEPLPPRGDSPPPLQDGDQTTRQRGQQTNDGKTVVIQKSGDDPESTSGDASAGSFTVHTDESGGLVTREDQVSADAGEFGQIVVLYPRVIPATNNKVVEAIADELHRELESIAQRGAPDAELNVRPKPERVCPQSGCKAVSVGAMLAHTEGKGCVIVGWIAKPMKSPATLYPLAGGMELKSDSAPFRDPIESHVTIKDFSICDEVMTEIDASELAAAIRAQMR